MKLYNSKKKGAPVNNVNDLNEYIRQVLCKTLIVTYNMFEADSEEVDEAIQELDYICEDDIVGAIQNKIEELASRRETEKQTEEENEGQRIRDLSDGLTKMFQGCAVKGEKGRFVGDPAKWHIHTEIKKVHLKYGRDLSSRAVCSDLKKIYGAINIIIERFLSFSHLSNLDIYTV